MTTAIEVEVKESPILFSGPMVRAILEGRKTQTRRVITNERIKAFAPGYADDRERILGLCPYGRVGDRLWVRETWAPHDTGVLSNQDREYIYYRADDEAKYETDGDWRNSMFMPRWASRITLEITNVRVERLVTLSDNDAKAEGFGSVDEFRGGWDRLNKKRGYQWSINPWVWILVFRRVLS